MPVEIVMPKLGLTMTEGMIVDWNFKEGDAVNQGDILFVLETEKVTYEVEAPASGILAKILTHQILLFHIVVIDEVEPQIDAGAFGPGGQLGQDMRCP